MNLLSLIDFSPSDPLARREFFDENALTHEALFDSIVDLGVVFDKVPLWTEDGGEDWLLVHDQEHRAMAAALGLGVPPDLSILDWTDAQQVADWVYDHYLIHQQLEQALGL